MFDLGRKRTVFGRDFNIVGSVTSDGLLEIYGKVDGELHCASLVIHSTAQITGPIKADKITVNGAVRGPIECREVILRSKADVVGDVRCRTLVIEKGALIDGNFLRLPEVKLIGAVKTPAWT